MTFYPPKINARFRSPQNAGRLCGANAMGKGVSFECGSFFRMSLKIDSETKTIRQAKFQTNGCGYMVAAGDVVAEMLSGRQLIDLHGLDQEEHESVLLDEVEGFPPERKQCADLVFTALKGALADFRSNLLEEFMGEKALICTCFGVSEEAIESYLEANSPVTVANVTDACRAGGGCGSCRMLIQELIDSREFEIKV
ncbi:MAG: iron-sulfur cluster assembly scaffold protein [Pyrinomonadaceae bacterium]